jgi:DNA polymerase elongation subunit (family B)
MAELGLDEPATKDRDKQVQRNKLALSLKYIKGYLDLFYAKLRGEKYKGAFVFPPKVKVYRKKVVGTFDFSSLYPSIIRAFNICRTTQVRSPQALPAHMLNVSPCEPQPFAYVKAR